MSEVIDVLRSGCYESPLRYDIVDWFVDEVPKLKNKLNLFFENSKKFNNMTEKDEEHCRKKKTCRFCEKGMYSDKVRDHCHIRGKYRDPTHIECNKNFPRKQSNFIPFVFHNFSNYDCHLFFKKLVDKKSDLILFLRQTKNTYQ